MRPDGRDATRAVYVISVAAELAGVHPQTLRIYERKGLVDPARTERRQPPLQRRRHRPAPPHPGAHQRGPQPRRRPAGAGARGRGRPAARRAGRRAPEGRPRPSPTPTASTAASWCRCSRRSRCSRPAARRADAARQPRPSLLPDPHPVDLRLDHVGPRRRGRPQGTERRCGQQHVHALGDRGGRHLGHLRLPVEVRRERRVRPQSAPDVPVAQSARRVVGPAARSPRPAPRRCRSCSCARRSRG